MPRLTAIVRQKRGRRVEVWIDGDMAFTLSLEVVAERGLRVDDELSADTIDDLQIEDQRRLAIAVALRYVAARPRSEKDLRQRLQRRGLPRAATDAAVERLKELGYVNDDAFASLWVEARQASTPRSRRHLLFELGRAGVASETAATAVAELSDDDAAYAAAQKRLRSLRGSEYRTFQQRLGSFLTARGFAYGVARGAIDRCWREMAEGDSAE